MERSVTLRGSAGTLGWFTLAVSAPPVARALSAAAVFSGSLSFASQVWLKLNVTVLRVAPVIAPKTRSWSAV